jgi:four helix bundle protein
MSNIAEGFERGGRAEFLQFLAISKGSAGEVESQLYVALDQGYIEEEQFAHLIALTTSTKRLIAGFMKYLQQTSLRGLKYKERAETSPQNHKP